MRQVIIQATVCSVLIASAAFAQNSQNSVGTTINTNRPGMNQQGNINRSGVNQQGNINYRYNNRAFSAPYVNQGAVTRSGTVIVRTPTPTRIIGNVAPYSETEYGQVVLQQIQSSMESQGGPISDGGPETSATRMGADNVSSISDASQQPLFQAYIEEITADGIFKTANGELAMRGVQIQGPDASATGTAGFGVAVALLKQLAEGKDVFYTVSKPEKNQRNQILAIIHTSDGTELNKMIVETGFGKVVPDEFENRQELRDLTSAEADARGSSRGMWQSRMLPQDLEPRVTPVPQGSIPSPTPAP